MTDDEKIMEMIRRCTNASGVPAAIYTPNGWIFHEDCPQDIRDRLLAEEAQALADVVGDE